MSEEIIFPEGQAPPGEAPERGSMLHGFLVSAGWNVLAASISAACIPIGIGIFTTIGFALLQLAWLLPLRSSYVRAKRTEDAKGVLITIGLTVLLSASCFGIVSNMSFR
jgi:hypothetical protein